jgi:hypothetical protein
MPGPTRLIPILQIRNASVSFASLIRSLSSVAIAEQSSAQEASRQVNGRVNARPN